MDCLQYAFSVQVGINEVCFTYLGTGTLPRLYSDGLQTQNGWMKGWVAPNDQWQRWSDSTTLDASELTRKSCKMYLMTVKLRDAGIYRSADQHVPRPREVLRWKWGITTLGRGSRDTYALSTSQTPKLEVLPETRAGHIGMMTSRLTPRPHPAWSCVLINEARAKPVGGDKWLSLEVSQHIVDSTPHPVTSPE